MHSGVTTHGQLWAMPRFPFGLPRLPRPQIDQTFYVSHVTLMLLVSCPGCPFTLVTPLRRMQMYKIQIKSSLFFLLTFSNDCPILDLGFKPIDGALVVHRKLIDGFDRTGLGVLVTQSRLNIGHESFDPNDHIYRLERNCECWVNMMTNYFE